MLAHGIELALAVRLREEGFCLNDSVMKKLQHWTAELLAKKKV